MTLYVMQKIVWHFTSLRKYDTKCMTQEGHSLRVLFITASNCFLAFLLWKSKSCCAFGQRITYIYPFGEFSSVKSSSSRGSELKIRCHRIALTNILPSSLLCPPGGCLQFSENFRVSCVLHKVVHTSELWRTFPEFKDKSCFIISSTNIRVSCLGEPGTCF